MVMKKIPLFTRSFFIGAGAGTLLGLLLMGVFVNYLVNRAKSDVSTNDAFLGGAIEQVRQGMTLAARERESTVVYGHVVSIGGGKLVLEVARTSGKKQYTFMYDDSTKIVFIANDAASSEVPLSSDEIEVGVGLNVFANEAIGSVADQHAVKIIKI